MSALAAGCVAYRAVSPTRCSQPGGGTEERRPGDGCGCFRDHDRAVHDVRVAVRMERDAADVCWLSATGVVLDVIDLRHRRLPHPVTAAMAAGGVLTLAVATAVDDRWAHFASALIAAADVAVTAAAVQFAFPTHTAGGDTMLFGALAAPEGRPTGTERISLAALGDQDWALPAAQGHYGRAVRTACRRAKIEPRYGMR